MVTRQLRFADLARGKNKKIASNYETGNAHLISNIIENGKILMLCDTALHRDLGGTTISYARIAKSNNLHRIHGIFPITSAACSAWMEIMFTGKILRRKNVLTRFIAANFVLILLLLKRMLSLTLDTSRQIFKANTEK